MRRPLGPARQAGASGCMRCCNLMQARRHTAAGPRTATAHLKKLSALWQGLNARKNARLPRGSATSSAASTEGDARIPCAMPSDSAARSAYGVTVPTRGGPQW
jgi:hypothetical protein